MPKDTRDDGRLLDMRDEAHATLAGGAQEHINAKDAHHESGPRETFSAWRLGLGASVAHRERASVLGDVELEGAADDEPAQR